MTVAAEVLVLAGAAFVAIAGIGVVRFGDLLSRMHAATKASTIAVVLLALGTVLGLDHGASEVLLAAALLFVTAPAGAHLVGRAAYRDEHIDVGLEGTDESPDAPRAPAASPGPAAGPEPEDEPDGVG